MELTSIFLCLLLLVLIKYNWDRRWLYYHSWKIDGPFLFPIVGIGYRILKGPQTIVETIQDLINVYPSVFKIWLGKDLMIVNSEPEDVEYILNNHLEKAQYYKWAEYFLRNSLLLLPVDIWKKHRKLIKPTFNSQILNSFPEVFDKHSKLLVSNMEDLCGQKFDVFNEMWKCTYDMACETLLNLDMKNDGYVYISKVKDLEKTLADRLCMPWLYLEFSWKVSPMFRKMKSLSLATFEYIQKTIQRKRLELTQCDRYSDDRKPFLEHLLSSTILSENDIVEETNLMMIASTETVASSLSFVTLLLGFFPEIQQKTYDEIYSIFGDSTRDTTLEDLNRMEYLERVIKESMRMFPAVPIIMRYLESDYQSKSCVIPKGSSILIPIFHIHRDSKYWENPDVFDPDRFLAEKADKIHRGTYIPFSLGSRNCIGFKYALLAMKTVISNLLKHYVVGAPVDYDSIRDLSVIFLVVGKANKDYRIRLHRRNSKNCSF